MRTTPKVQCLFIIFIEGRYVVRKSHAEFFKSFNLFAFNILGAFYKPFLFKRSAYSLINNYMLRAIFPCFARSVFLCFFCFFLTFFF